MFLLRKKGLHLNWTYLKKKKKKNSIFVEFAFAWEENFPMTNGTENTAKQLLGFTHLSEAAFHAPVFLINVTAISPSSVIFQPPANESLPLCREPRMNGALTSPQLP